MNTSGSSSDAEKMKILLAAGADASSQTDEGQSPLGEAVRGNRVAAVGFLLRHTSMQCSNSARIYECTNGLASAASRGHTDCISVITQSPVWHVLSREEQISC